MNSQDVVISALVNRKSKTVRIGVSSEVQKIIVDRDDGGNYYTPHVDLDDDIIYFDSPIGSRIILTVLDQLFTNIECNKDGINMFSSRVNFGPAETETIPN